MLNAAIFILCLICAAFFAATEVAFFSLTPLTVTRGNRRKLEKLYLQKNDLIAMLLTGNSFAIVTGTLALDTLLPPEKELSYKIAAFFIELVLFFLLSEALPKAFGRKKNVLLLEKAYGLIWFFYFLLLPLSYIFLQISRFIGRFGSGAGHHKYEDARLEVFQFISEHTDENKLLLTESMATYAGTTVREVMTPMSELFSLSASARLIDCAEIIERSSYSRYPVYENIPAEIKGYVDLKDVLAASPGTRVRQIVREAHFFPYSLKVDQLHTEMLRLKQAMVFVVNEYGLVLGMVTEENLAEELVGDIFSHDQKLETEYLTVKENGVFEVDALMDIDDFKRYFSLPIEKENFETLGGYVMTEAGRVPALNETLENSFGKFTVIQGSDRAVKRLTFRPKKFAR